MKRIFIKPDNFPDLRESQKKLRLPDEAGHYVSNVLRLETGDPVELFDGQGLLVSGKLLHVSRGNATVHIETIQESTKNESPSPISLYQAIPKGDRWRWVLEKSTELGVTEIVPLETRRTIVDIPENKTDRKLDRWTKIVGSAARQSRRSHIPELTRQHSLAEVPDMSDGDLKLVASTTSDRSFDELKDSIVTENVSIDIAVGPEGGLTSDEEELLTDAGFIPINLGPRTLRSETAATTAVSIIQFVFGDLG